jgi:CRISPR-associated protein Csx10
MKQMIKIETLQPVIMTQSSATQGGVESLSYVTGSSLLGLAAAKLYSTLDEQQAWQMFHSGDTQFSHAYPRINGYASVPVAACLHFEKMASWQKDDKLNADALSVHSASEFVRNDDIQYKQCRDGFVNALGEVAKVKQVAITKTALNERQTAQDGQLFNYQAIEAGQVFIASISGDSDVVEKITKAIEGEQRLGRSRSSEFGKVRITAIDESPTELLPLIVQGSAKSTSLTLLCLSDVEALNENGEPTYTPELNELAFGVSGTFNPKKSFIRTHTVSLFNRARAGFDGEQCLITKGSVLVFEQVSGDLSVLANGIGQNRQLGLGQVVVNPSWLAQPNVSLPLFSASKIDETEIDDSKTQPQTQDSKSMSDLIRFAQERSEQASSKYDDQTLINNLLARVVHAYNSARRYNHIVDAHKAGPSNSQLRRVANEIRNTHSKPIEVLIADLFEGDHAICKTEGDELGWGIAWHNGSEFTQFAAEMKDILKNAKTTQRIERFIEQLCRYEPSDYQSMQQLIREQDLADDIDKLQLEAK